MAEKWIEEFEGQITAKTANTFLFHGDVADDVLFNGDFWRLYEVLPQLKLVKDAGIVAFFNLASGMRFVNDEMEKFFLQLIIKPIVDRIPAEARPSPKEYFDNYKYKIEYVLEWSWELLLYSWEDVVNKAEKNPDLTRFIGKYSKQKMNGIPFAVTVFEYMETKTPPESATGSSQLDRKVVETFQWWAQLPEIKKKENIIVLISDFLASVAPQLHDQAKGIIPITVPLPSREELPDTIKVFQEKGIYVPLENEGKILSVEELSRLCAGLSRVELEQIFKQARVHKEKLTVPTLFEKKAKIIQARLGDMVRLKRPAWGWECIGGMDDRIALAMMWTEAMRKGNVARMPKGGIILLGAPGTGKTVFAEAFAHELDLPFLEVMNTFNQFVGVSEQNMQNLLDTAWAMRPCVLFFDEIEQLLLPRGEVYHGDSGVFARSSRMLMQFFSDPTIHGQVVIFAATNRPDLLDAAMKRAGRFGAKIPFLIPAKEDRPSIWKALLRKEIIRFGLSGIKLEVSSVLNDDKLINELSVMADFWEKNGLLVCGPPDSGKIFDEEETIPLTGAEMEDIIGLSFQPSLSDADLKQLQNMPREEWVKYLSEKFPFTDSFELTGPALKEAMKNYLPHEDVRTYKAMDDLALLSVKDLRLIPEKYRNRVRKLQAEHSRRRVQ